MSVPPPGQWPPPPPSSPPPPQWGPQPPNSQNRSANTTKWLLGGLALLTVVLVTVVATSLITRDGYDSPNTATASALPTRSIGASDVASAEDDGPIAIITDDPTCAAWVHIGDTFAAIALEGWDDRDPLIPASSWTPQQRAQHEAIAEAMRSSADQTIALIRQTPHRVMRELYEQSIAYWREYAQSVPNYVPEDDHLARAAVGAANSLSWICSAITYGSAQSRAPLTVSAPAPLEIQPPDDPSNPTRYVTRPWRFARNGNSWSTISTIRPQISSRPTLTFLLTSGHPGRRIYGRPPLLS